MNEAIKLAVKHGYVPSFWSIGIPEVIADYQANPEKVLAHLDMKGDPLYWSPKFVLDPLFWQALGKVLGWKCFCADWDKEKHSKVNCGNCGGSGYLGWKNYAHDYFDLVLTSGDTEKFWKELINA